MLGRQVQEMIHLEAVRDKLEAQLERTLLPNEWASAAESDIKELKQTLTRGRRSKNTMILSNLRLVVWIAKRYQNRGLLFQDIVQEGLLGLVGAVEKFDPEKGFRFSTYATWWIEQSVRRAIRDQSRTIRLPMHVHDIIILVNKHKRELHIDLGRAASDEEVSVKAGITLEKYRWLMSASRPTLSFESTFIRSKWEHDGGGSELILAGLIRDHAPCPAELTECMMLKLDVKELLKETLSSREQDVVRWRFGLGGGRRKTLREIARILSVTSERVRQIENKALLKLRKTCSDYELREYAMSLRAN